MTAFRLLNFLSITLVILKLPASMKIFFTALLLFCLAAASNGQKPVAAKTPSPDIQNALNLINSRQFAEAEKLLRDVLKKTPADTDARFLLGTVLIQTDKTEEGVKNLEAVVKINPKHLQANYNLALIYSRKGENKKAIPFLERAAGIYPPNKTPKTDDAVLLAALTRAYIFEGRKKDAENLIPLLEKLSAQDIRVLFTLGLIQAELGNYEKAAQIFERVNAQRPNTTDVLYNLGIAYYNLDKLAEAKVTLLQAVSLNPSQPEFYYRLGLIYSAEKDSDAAVSYWLKAIELKPDYHEPNFLIGEELLKNKKVSGALPFYKKAAELQLDRVLYQLRLGVTYFRLQQYTDARKVFEQVLVKYPEDPNFNYLKGYMARAEGLFDEALASFEKVLKIKPDHPDVLASMGYIALERGDLVKAEQILRQTIKLDAKNFPAFYDLGRLLNRQKKFVEAVPILEKGASLKTDDPGVRYQLFLAYSRLKQKEKADVAFAEFKRLEKTFNVGSGSSTSADKVPDLPENIGGSSNSADKLPERLEQKQPSNPADVIQKKP